MIAAFILKHPIFRLIKVNQHELTPVVASLQLLLPC